MSGITKKIITFMVIFALMATPTLTVYAASPNGNPPGQQQKQNEENQKGNSQNAPGHQQATAVASPSAPVQAEADKQPKHSEYPGKAPDKMPATPSNESAVADKGKSADHKAGQNSHAQLDTTAIGYAIASVSDPNAQKNLLALLAAYQNALDALKSAQDSHSADTVRAERDAAVAAQSALLKALYASGIKLAMVLGNGAENKAAQNAGSQLDTVAIQASIDAIADASAHASLDSLLAAYQVALDTFRKDLYSGASGHILEADRAALDAAKNALLDALSASQTASPSPSPSPSATETPQPDEPDIAAIQAAIANLTDVDLQASLLGLVTAYQTAQDTLKNDTDANAPADTLQADQESVQTAKDALMKALADAQITLPSPTPSPSPSATESPAASETMQAQTQDTGTVWTSIVDWFMGLFGQQSN